MLSFRGLRLTAITPEFIRQIVEGGIEPHVITSLNLADNELSSPVGLNVFGNLTHLDLSFNNISIIRGIPATVTHLNLAHNSLEQIYGLDTLLSLYEVDLSYNKLSDMTGLSYNVELRTVKLGGNRIPYVASLEPLKNLESIDLSNNDFQALDDLRCLSFNVHLKNLWLVGNPVTSLRGYKSTCRNLLPGLYTLDGKKLINPGRDSSDLFHKTATVLPNERIDGRKNYGTNLILRSYASPASPSSAATSPPTRARNSPNGYNTRHFQASPTPTPTPPPTSPYNAYLNTQNAPLTPPHTASFSSTQNNTLPSALAAYPPTPPPNQLTPSKHPDHVQHMEKDPYSSLKSLLPPDLVSILPPPHVYSAPQNVFLVQQTPKNSTKRPSSTSRSKSATPPKPEISPTLTDIADYEPSTDTSTPPEYIQNPIFRSYTTRNRSNSASPSYQPPHNSKRPSSTNSIHTAPTTPNKLNTPSKGTPKSQFSKQASSPDLATPSSNNKRSANNSQSTSPSPSRPSSSRPSSSRMSPSSSPVPTQPPRPTVCEDREAQTKNNSRSMSARALLADVVQQKRQLMQSMEEYRKQFPKSDDIPAEDL